MEKPIEPTIARAHYVYSIDSGHGGGSYRKPREWQTRPLGQEMFNEIPGSKKISGELVELPQGIYIIGATVLSSGTGQTAYRIRNFFDPGPADVMHWNGGYCEEGKSHESCCSCRYIIGSGDSAAIRVSMIAEKSKEDTGMGFPNSLGVSEVYFNLWIDYVGEMNAQS